MAKIGPTFTEELRAAGVSDFRFSWSGNTGVIDFHPDFPDDERKKVEAVLAAHDGPLSEARHEALEAADAEAARRIADMFRKQPDSWALVWKEMNAQARASQILYSILKKAGLAVPEEQPDLELLEGMYNRARAIRDAEDKAKAALLAAKSVEEVEAVKPEWPGE